MTPKIKHETLCNFFEEDVLKYVGNFAISVATSSIIVRVSLPSQKRASPRGISYNFSEAPMKDGGGVSKIAAKSRYKRQEELEDDPLKSTKNSCKTFEEVHFQQTFRLS